MLTGKEKLLLFPLLILSKLPLKILYSFSGFLYFLIYYVARYRKKVVRRNLKHAFPQKSKEECKAIEKKFFRYFSENILEIMHMFSMDYDSMLEHFAIKNPELFHNLYKQGKNICAMASHYGNWEWPNYIGRAYPFSALGVYKPLSNKLFNRLFIYLRGKFDSKPVTMRNTMREILEHQKAKKLFVIYLIGDQRPPKREMKYWQTFMNQETCMITGPEKLARKYNMATVFIDMQRTKRGYYEIEFKLIAENSAETKEHEITAKYVKLVEQQIERKPEFYLWSHKRWKHKRTDQEGIR